MADREWPRLTPEQKEETIERFKRCVEDGLVERRLDPSLLGLDWDCFSMREYKDPAASVRWIEPLEFVTIAFSILDAYAGAVLASGVALEPAEEMVFHAKLTRFMIDGDLKIDLWVGTERWPFSTFDYSNEIYDAFRDFLGARGFEKSKTAFAFGEGPGCPMHIHYPGQMKPASSSLMRDRPVDDWPHATLTLHATETVRGRSREVLVFLRSTPEAGPSPN